MQIISKRQQEVVALSLFAQRLQQHWEHSFPTLFVKFSEDQLSELAKSAIEGAAMLSIEQENDIVAWSDLCLVSRTGFAQNIDTLGGSNE